MSNSAGNGVHGTPYIWCFLGAILVHSSARAAHGGQADPPEATARGDLRIDGGHIERLILRDEQDRQMRFVRPGQSLLLPPGRYRLHEVALSGGYVCRPHLVPEGRQVSIEPGRPAVLTLGAPLRQTVRIERWGTSMVLHHDLLGQGGERYAVREDAERPAFVVFKGKNAVSSGRFDLEPGGTCSHVWRVPLAASGRLRIVPSYDLGALGPGEGETTLCTWHWFQSIPGLPLWVTLVLAMILPRSNRTPRTLLILAPVILVYLGWQALAAVLPLDSSQYETSRITVLSLAVGIALLWLTDPPLARQTWRRSLFGAMAVAAATVLIGVVSLSIGLSDQTIRFASVMSVLMSAAALGHVLSRRTCRGRNKSGRLVLSLAAWTIAASIVAMSVMIVIWCTTYGGWLGDAEYVLWLIFFVGPSLGICVFAMSLPFLLAGPRATLP
jgi:hypothetical protein